MGIITRVTSIGLLIFIYYEHWSEVEVVTANLKLALIETMPYVILLALGNIGLQFACSKRSFICGIISFLFPNGYLAKPHCAGRYIFSKLFIQRLDTYPVICCINVLLLGMYPRAIIV